MSTQPDNSGKRNGAIEVLLLVFSVLGVLYVALLVWSQIAGVGGLLAAGGSIGDALNPLVALLAFLALLKAIQLQKRDLDVQRRELRQATAIHEARLRREEDSARPRLQIDVLKLYNHGIQFEVTSLTSAVAYDPVFYWHSREHPEFDERKQPIRRMLNRESEPAKPRIDFDQVPGDNLHPLGLYMTYEDEPGTRFVTRYHVWIPGRGLSTESYPRQLQGAEIWQQQIQRYGSTALPKDPNG